MNRTRICLISFAFFFSSSVLSQSDECGPFEGQLSDGTCYKLNTGGPTGSGGAVMAVGLVAVGYGIYKISSSGDTLEEANMRAQEIADGLGIRLNEISSPLRISTMKPILNSNPNISSERKVLRRKNKINLLDIEYRF